MKLDDQFEWDIENPDSTPEQFAEVYGNDLGLAGEFKYKASLIWSISSTDYPLQNRHLTLHPRAS